MSKLKDDDYRRLLTFRVELRDFLRWSEQEAHAAGLTPALHQLLLVVRGEALPTISQAAAKLHIRHNSTVELVHRAEDSGLLERTHDPADHRLVRLALTPHGEHCLEQLTLRHLPRIVALAAELDGVVGPQVAASRVTAAKPRARRR